MECQDTDVQVCSQQSQTQANNRYNIEVRELNIIDASSYEHIKAILKQSYRSASKISATRMDETNKNGVKNFYVTKRLISGNIHETRIKHHQY